MKQTAQSNQSTLSRLILQADSDKVKMELYTLGQFWMIVGNGSIK